VDTNVLIYSRDLDAAAKRVRSIEVIEGLPGRGELSLSAQCLNEFSAVMLRRGLSIQQVATAVARWCDLAEVLPLTGAATAVALRAVAQRHLSFWEALIWAVAREAGVPVIVSEDFQDGRELEGVQFLNPFLRSRLSD
jgi:predicted nucleic acid-binding protein